MPVQAYESGMELLRIYECLCDRTRLRLLNLLTQGPLCVCHFQELLGEPQVKISKHLAYLRARALVQVERDGSRMIYELPAKPSRELAANLACQPARAGCGRGRRALRGSGRRACRRG